jgi:hypothetical protein
MEMGFRINESGFMAYLGSVSKTAAGQPGKRLSSRVLASQCATHTCTHFELPAGETATVTCPPAAPVFAFGEGLSIGFDYCMPRNVLEPSGKSDGMSGRAISLSAATSAATPAGTTAVLTL